MPVPSTVAELSQTIGSNSPSGSDSPTVIDDHMRALASFVAYLRDGKQYSTESTLASASTTDIGLQNSFYVNITGTTTITSFGTDYQGPRFLRFSAALTLTNSSSLVLPGGANITTAAGDTCIAVPFASGWRVTAYQRAALAPGVPADGSVSFAKLLSSDWTSSLTTAGYQRLPSGLIVQWGAFTGGTSVTLPITFPTSNLALTGTVHASGGPISVLIVQSFTQSSFFPRVIRTTDGTTVADSGRYIAIGY
ncbi:hypothetical protein WG922_21640 [Ramlibacter sp. AN1015]|uniref:gp53-like domain-containing protein n=1 Tax=Ramlibacter sp. AN1015 TaxID=3133428 RepID=UPI0030BA76DD